MHWNKCISLKSLQCSRNFSTCSISSLVFSQAHSIFVVLTFFSCSLLWNFSPSGHSSLKPPTPSWIFCPCVICQKGISKACSGGGWLVVLYELLSGFRASLSLQLGSQKEGIKLSYSHLLSQKSKELNSFELSRHCQV